MHRRIIGFTKREGGSAVGDHLRAQPDHDPDRRRRHGDGMPGPGSRTVLSVMPAPTPPAPPIPAALLITPLPIGLIMTTGS